MWSPSSSLCSGSLLRRPPKHLPHPFPRAGPLTELCHDSARAHSLPTCLAIPSLLHRVPTVSTGQRFCPLLSRTCPEELPARGGLPATSVKTAEWCDGLAVEVWMHRAAGEAAPLPTQLTRCAGRLGEARVAAVLEENKAREARSVLAQSRTAGTRLTLYGDSDIGDQPSPAPAPRPVAGPARGQRGGEAFPQVLCFFPGGEGPEPHGRKVKSTHQPLKLHLLRAM